jgi:hypothetical protein
VDRTGELQTMVWIRILVSRRELLSNEGASENTTFLDSESEPSSSGPGGSAVQSLSAELFSF